MIPHAKLVLDLVQDLYRVARRCRLIDSEPSKKFMVLAEGVAKLPTITTKRMRLPEYLVRTNELTVTKMDASFVA